MTPRSGSCTYSAITTPRPDIYASNPAGTIWHKASSRGTDNNCVEFAELPGAETLYFTASEWSAFQDGIIAGEL
ncbi:DUF397 domain-containing protein [Streptomyces sp. NPDC056670]|uniref:DUF397 domain-containing protein n=1 Tax=Streptomyces sp. NPDC056670 TaxID=3345904 RepID=UPI00367FA2C1